MVTEIPLLFNLMFEVALLLASSLYQGEMFVNS